MKSAAVGHSTNCSGVTSPAKNRGSVFTTPMVFVGCLTFLCTGLFINAVQAVLYLLLKPYSPRTFRRLYYYLNYVICTPFIYILEWWSGSDAIVYADPDIKAKLLGHENAMLLVNHTYEVDWLMLCLVAERLQVLGGAKSFLKRSLLKMPIMGWNWFFGECIFLERDWNKDQLTMGSQIERALDQPNPTWIFFFAEGTRFTPEKHKNSMEVARSKGIPELKHHLLPRTKGFVACLPHLRGKMDALYDVVIGISPKHAAMATMKSIIYGTPVQAHMLIRRIPLKEVPEDPSEAAEWLQELYRRKDRVMDAFVQSANRDAATFPLDKQHELQNYREYRLPRRPYSLISEIFWIVATVIPVFYGIMKVLALGNHVAIAVVVALLLIAYLGIRKMISATKVEKASSYGTKVIKQD